MSAVASRGAAAHTAHHEAVYPGDPITVDFDGLVLLVADVARFIESEGHAWPEVLECVADLYGIQNEGRW